MKEYQEMSVLFHKKVNKKQINKYEIIAWNKK